MQSSIVAAIIVFFICFTVITLGSIGLLFALAPPVGTYIVALILPTSVYFTNTILTWISKDL